MKFQTAIININPKAPVKQAGYAQQVVPISEVHDPLFARILMLINENGKRFIHIALDNLGAPTAFMLAIKQELEDQLDVEVKVIVSCTHTHFAPDMKDEGYCNQVKRQLIEACLQMKPIESELKCSFIRHPFKLIGNSRISRWETEDIYAQVLSFYQGEQRVASLLIYNCHPTILDGNTPYFTSEYPGVALRYLQQQYPNEYFAFLQGATGDVSTRFTRTQQTWQQVEEFGKIMAEEFSNLLQQAKPKFDCDLDYREGWVKLRHDLTELDKVEIPDYFSQREKETIQYGIDKNVKLRSNLSLVPSETLICVLNVGPIRLVFSEYELFSEYNQIMNDHAALVCYSQGYSHYVTGPSFHGLTYESLQDSLTKSTKQEIITMLTRFSK